MRPVNLIPREQRRRLPRAPGEETRPGVYVFLGVLALVVLAVAGLVLTQNSVNEKKGELAKVKKQSEETQEVAQQLDPYAEFASAAQGREETISSLARSRFDWERTIRQLSRVIPDNVQLTAVAGTVSPDVEAGDSGGGGGEAGSLRDEEDAPAITLDGCAVNHHGVARLLSRLRNLDLVTKVRFASSVRKTEEDSAGGGAAGGAVTPAPGAPTPAGAVDTGGGEDEGDDCRTKEQYTKFSILVVFGGFDGGPAGGEGQATPSPIEKANAAKQQAESAGGAAGGQPAAGGSP